MRRQPEANSRTERVHRSAKGSFLLHSPDVNTRKKNPLGSRSPDDTRAPISAHPFRWRVWLRSTKNILPEQHTTQWDEVRSGCRFTHMVLTRKKKKKQKRFKEHLKPNGVRTRRRLNKFRLARRTGKINCGTLWIIEMIPEVVRRVDIMSLDGEHLDV